MIKLDRKISFFLQKKKNLVEHTFNFLFLFILHKVKHKIKIYLTKLTCEMNIQNIFYKTIVFSMKNPEPPPSTNHQEALQ